MKKSIIFVSFLFLAACGQSYNSNFNDSATYGDIGITPGSNFYNANVVLQSKCFSCHGDQWKGYKTSGDWITNGLIVSGSLTNSDIYTSLKNNGGSMPKDPYSALSSTELETIKTWILSP